MQLPLHNLTGTHNHHTPQIYVVVRCHTYHQSALILTDNNSRSSQRVTSLTHTTPFILPQEARQDEYTACNCQPSK
ncbi:hypothetical protein E2C01_008694 [Portunus trituberculatus]|uniref:Uncharacterized protein n=1 Tax=Portunus trituberculatus TaxID=210409 RepID=A0A5B7D2I3_PORTR|nr:hypothetical protein [Portunus trituberculatus]